MYSTSVETSEYLDKTKKGWKGYTDESFKEACKRFGIYVIRTNVGHSLQKIYEYYKSRFEIEYAFDTLKNTLAFDKVYMHSDKALESWAFINHISILTTQRVYDYLSEHKICYSFHSTVKRLKQVVMQRTILDTNDNYVLQVVPKKTRDLLINLELNI